jgi:hypothetical protein
MSRRHDRNTNGRKLPDGLALGDCWVLVRSNRSGVLAALAVFAAAFVVLGGCSDVDTGQAWLAKPFDISGRSAGYSFSELSETKKEQHPITANDLVNGNGSCAAPVAAAPAQVAAAGTPPGPPAAAPPSAAPSDPSALMGGGVALGMSECDLVYRAGQPSSVQIGNAPNGDRAAVLTFQSGPHPGIYRFLRGALTEMDRVAETAPPPQVAKKKPAKPPKKAAQN